MHLPFRSLVPFMLLITLAAPADRGDAATDDPRTPEVNQLIQPLTPEVRQRVTRLWDAGASDQKTRDDLYKALKDLHSQTTFRMNDPNFYMPVGSLGALGGVGTLIAMGELGMMGSVAGPVGFVAGAAVGATIGYLTYRKGQDFARWRFGNNTFFRTSTIERLEQEHLRRADPAAKQHWWQFWRSRPTWPPAPAATSSTGPGPDRTPELISVTPEGTVGS